MITIVIKIYFDMSVNDSTIAMNPSKVVLCLQKVTLLQSFNRVQWD